MIDRPLLTVVVLITTLLASTSFGGSESDLIVQTSPEAEQRELAMAQGVAALRASQAQDGHWEYADHSVGLTSLCALGLINAGVATNDPAILSALEYVKSKQTEAAYDVGLRAAFYSQVPVGYRRRELPADVRFLTQWAMDAKGGIAGLYGYKRGEERVDFSNSQYGVLGVWFASAYADIPVPNSYWVTVGRAWMSNQREDGGWTYQPGLEQASYASMTAAGVATLLLLDERINVDRYQNINNPGTFPELQRGLAWIGRNFEPYRNTGHRDASQPPFKEPPPPDEDAADDAREPETPDLSTVALPAPPPTEYNKSAVANGWFINYMLYGYERVGEASGLASFGGYDWFAEGSRFLIATQDKTGIWRDSYSNEAATAYALLFLGRGRAPIAVQELAWGNRIGSGEDPNLALTTDHRPRDVPRMVRFLGRTYEQNLNWQMLEVAFSDPSLSDSAPILYVSGHDAIELSEVEKLFLQRYVRRGGLAVFVQEGEGVAFADSALGVMSTLLPEAQVGQVPPEHPLLSNELAKAYPHPVLSLDNGVRLMAIVLPAGDAAWQLHSTEPRSHDRESPFGLFASIYAYATDGISPPARGTRIWIEADPDKPQAKTNVTLARVNLGRGSNPEPVAMERLANMLHNDGRLELDVVNTTLADIADTKADLFHFGSVNPVEFSPELDAAVQHLAGTGRFFILEAVGGKADVAESLRRLVRSSLPQANVSLLPADHPLYLTLKPIGDVSYRRFDAERLPPTAQPMLQGIFMGNKLIGVLSEFDLTTGLVGYPRQGILGYTPRSSYELMARMCAYSMEH